MIDRRFGFSWSVGGFLLMPFLREAGRETAERMRGRVSREITTTFKSTYSREIGLAEALNPEVVRAYEAKRTGEKFLICP